MSRNPKPINAGLELKLARRRAQDCVSEAATILVDAMPLVPRDQAEQWTAIIGQLSSLKQHLEDLQ